MRCAWQSYLKLLPPWLSTQVDALGKDALQELRLRVGQAPLLVLKEQSVYLKRIVCGEDLQHIINAATQYSPWSAQSIRSGYVTVQGGHRIGICGECILQNDGVTAIRYPTSLCLRVARDFYGIAKGTHTIQGNILIIGSPGTGKTTLLRDVIRQRAKHNHESIAVVDERGEIFPTVGQTSCFIIDGAVDILQFCPKHMGTDMLLRTMNPSCIAVDEITKKEDCDALYRAGWCGVTLIATAHAANKDELFNRPVYRPIIDSGLFQTLLIMQPDKSWKAERVALCK